MKLPIIILLSLMCLSLSAQSPLTRNADEELEDNFVDPDSVDYESYTKKTSSFKALFNGKPGKAILYGMLIPGGGQMYNKDYWKVPIALAAEGAGVYTFIYLRNEYRNFNEAYRRTLEGEENAIWRGIFGEDSLNAFRKRYQKYSEQAGIGMIAIHILVAVESYIDRHLSVFDIDEDLSFDYTAPAIDGAGRTMGLSLTYTF